MDWFSRSVEGEKKKKREKLSRVNKSLIVIANEYQNQSCEDKRGSHEAKIER